LLCSLLFGWFFLGRFFLRRGLLLSSGRRSGRRRAGRLGQAGCARVAGFGAYGFLFFFFIIFFHGTAAVATHIAVIVVHVILMPCLEGLIVKAHSSSRRIRAATDASI